jgi:hypothetical protein
MENNIPSHQKAILIGEEEKGHKEKSEVVVDETEEETSEKMDADLELNQQKKETRKNKEEAKNKESLSAKENKDKPFEGMYFSAEPKPEKKKQPEDNTRTFVSEAKSASKTVVLAVQQVQILAKTNPDDIARSSSKNNNGNPMQTFGQKPGSGSSYSIDDIPKFPGGDRALQNYFAGKLRPIKIKESENKFDKSVMIDLEINFRGKLKDYSIYGQLHPDHQKVLIKAIEELPRFGKGNENITYSLGIAF